MIYCRIKVLSIVCSPMFNTLNEAHPSQTDFCEAVNWKRAWGETEIRGSYYWWSHITVIKCCHDSSHLLTPLSRTDEDMLTVWLQDSDWEPSAGEQRCWVWSLLIRVWADHSCHSCHTPGERRRVTRWNLTFDWFSVLVWLSSKKQNVSPIDKQINSSSINFLFSTLNFLL